LYFGSKEEAAIKSGVLEKKQLGQLLIEL